MSIYVNFENMFKAFHVWLLINCNVCGGVMTMVNMCTGNCHFYFKNFD